MASIVTFLVHRLVLMLMYPAAVRSIKGKLYLSLEICRRHKMGQSYTSLSKEYGLRKSTIHDIVQSEDRLTEYSLEIQHASGPKRSIIRRSKYDELDKALHLWFLQKRAMGMPVMLLQSLKNDAARKRSANLKQLSMNDVMQDVTTLTLC